MESNHVVGIFSPAHTPSLPKLLASDEGGRRTRNLMLCWLQQEFGFVSLGESEGTFIINAYPVSVHYTDVLLIFLTVIAVGWLSVWYPVRYLSKRLLE